MNETLAARYRRIRALSPELCATLHAEDTVIQTMPDVSPTKWHLAHVTWFFERFVASAHIENYRLYNEKYDFLFNSYYYTAGEMHARPRRRLLSRPTITDILSYRKHVDNAMLELIESRDNADDNAAFDHLVTLGLNHEQQHQELLLTDIKHVFSCNPLRPALDPALKSFSLAAPQDLTFHAGESGVHPIGASGDGFEFDNETPRHEVLLQEHRIANRLTTNAEFRQFIDDSGYQQSELWLSDAWAVVNERNWRRPFYWSEDLQSEFTLGGDRELDPSAPVSHISFYEADAYARWAGARLPTEFEWESAASQHDVEGNLLESGYWHPTGSEQSSQYFGDVWEWTASSYAPYPGFEALAGSLGEYNGKFMCNQMTVRGGSCVTSKDHIRPSYRNFFYPDARWQFLGFRLARDGHS